MYVSYDVHAQAVRDRQQALRRDADLHRLVTPTPRCSWAAQALRRVAARLGAAAVSPDGCGGRPKPGVAESG
jgi:hypothetical protein